MSMGNENEEIVGLKMEVESLREEIVRKGKEIERLRGEVDVHRE